MLRFQFTHGGARGGEVVPSVPAPKGQEVEISSSVPYSGRSGESYITGKVY